MTLQAKPRGLRGILGRLSLGKTMAFCAHITTAITFGTAIYAFFYPESAVDFLAKVSRQIDDTNARLDGIAVSTMATADNTAATADNTRRMADAVADRPRLEVRQYGSGAVADRQTQVTIHNETTRTLQDAVLLGFDASGKGFGSLDVFAVPPLESVTEPLRQPVTTVCYSFVVNEDVPRRYTETRAFSPNEFPTLDDIGNAATYDVKPLSYDFRVEPEPGTMTCLGTPYEIAAIRKARAKRGD